MAGIQQLKAWFFGITSEIRDDGTTGGVRLRKGDQPTQQTMENLLASSTFSKESSDRAKLYSGSTNLGTEQGLVVLATDAQAKANTSQLGDRSLVVQPSQLPTVHNGTGTDDAISNSILNFSGVALDIQPDSTTTRNRYVGKLSNAFKTWLGLALDAVGGNFIPLDGTEVGSPLNGNIQASVDNSIYYNPGGGAPISEIKPHTTTGYYGSEWNTLRTYVIGGGTPTNPANVAQLNQSPGATILTTITAGNGSALQSDSTGIKVYPIGSVDVGIGITSGTYEGLIKSTNLTADRIYQLPNSSGTLGLSYTSVSTSSITIGNGSKAFTVGDGYSYTKGNRVRATTNGGTYFVEGIVSSYSAGVLTILVDATVGTGTFIAWTLDLGGTPPDKIATRITAASTSALSTSYTDPTGLLTYTTPNDGITRAFALSGSIKGRISTDGNSDQMDVQLNIPSINAVVSSNAATVKAGFGFVEISAFVSTIEIVPPNTTITLKAKQNYDGMTMRTGILIIQQIY